jgi:anti-anti-sigma factor
MVHIGSSFAVPDRPSLQGPGPETSPTVVWLHGEYDISTDGALCRTLARAIALNDAALVLDLSDVKHISASTLGVIVSARKLLRQQSRPLTVRSPSAFVRRIIGICGLDELFGPSPEDGAVPEALGSWVEIPLAGQAAPQPGAFSLAPDLAAAHVG